MSELFKPGEHVGLETSGQTCRIEEFLGGGGQGEVYSVRHGERLWALKWYYPQSATPGQRIALEKLIKIKSYNFPSPEFLWPEYMASRLGYPGYGYLMPLREKRFHGIVDILNQQVDPSFRSLVNAGIKLADSFLLLHSKGLCYCDISFGNVFFDPENGDIMICDNDNVGVDGENNSGVLGTPRFMAPEVVIGSNKPSIQTDLYSLAVLLFYMFFLHHPLEGRFEADIQCMDLAAMQKLYGKNAKFIFDPNDESNRPVPGLHDNALTFWPLYPQFLREIFVRAFTQGIKDPKDGRVRESEWRAGLSKLRDLIYYCPNCSAENFVHEGEDPLDTVPESICWGCGCELTVPFRLCVGRQTVVLNQDTRIFTHHVDPRKRNDFSTPVAELAQHPVRPEVWGLKNLSNTKWTTLGPNGKRLEVDPGRSVSIAYNTRIHFGTSEGVIV
ncbi:MAG: serine/threonine protein kinase [Candidatus Methylacidiphilales bacterium]|nr:hypothetical protein [Candidatus Methylacidiphilales bacterium]